MQCIPRFGKTRKGGETCERVACRTNPLRRKGEIVHRLVSFGLTSSLYTLCAIYCGYCTKGWRVGTGSRFVITVEFQMSWSQIDGSWLKKKKVERDDCPARTRQGWPLPTGATGAAGYHSNVANSPGEGSLVLFMSLNQSGKQQPHTSKRCLKHHNGHSVDSAAVPPLPTSRSRPTIH